MTIAVASGKGGAGKTSVASALAASFGSSCVVADCDVDAANGAIALGARIRETEAYFAGPGYAISPLACTGCGRCVDSCRFEAIARDSGTGGYAIVSELCERCGACVDSCPSGAVQSEEKEAGKLFVSGTRLGVTLVHAELVPGEDTSGKLVRKVRERAEALAGDEGVIVVDAPPGIGCPVIASLAGTDLVLVVADSSVSGLRDAQRLIELLASMKRESIALLNKCGLDPGIDGTVRKTLGAAGIPIAGEIPFDEALRSAEERGLTWLDVSGRAGDRVRMAMETLGEFVQELRRQKAS